MKRFVFSILLFSLVLSLSACSQADLPEEFQQAYEEAHSAQAVAYSGETTISQGDISQTNQIQYYGYGDKSMYQTTSSAGGDTLTIFTIGQDQYSKTPREDAWSRKDPPADYAPPWQRSTLEDICEEAQSISSAFKDGVLEVTFTYDDSQTVYTVAGGMLMGMEIGTNLYGHQEDGSLGAIDFRSVYQIQNIGAEAVESIIDANLPQEGFS